MSVDKSIKPLPPKTHYYSAIFKSILLAFAILIFSLGIGIAGYCYHFNFGFVDGLINASMILGGMGPVDIATTNGAKIFASIYALYSGVAFLSIFAIILAPVLHRFLHRFHLDLEE